MATAKPASVLVELEARAPKDWKDQKVIMAFATDVVAMAGSNTLSTGDEFYRAAKLAVWDAQEYRVGRVRYELLLAAVAKGQSDAEKDLPDAWDNLLQLLGRPTRFDSRGLARLNPGLFTVEPPPPCIAAVWRDAAAARAAAAPLQNNAEVKASVDADQEARRDGTFRTEAGRKADNERNARMIEIIAKGELHTAADFSNAALVMQHSAVFSGYKFAHELAVCSLLLGDRGSAPWLACASYDRMLRSVGHDQRFGTQQTMEGPPVRVDEEGICDNERQALRCPTLAQARSRRSDTSALRKELSGPDNMLRDHVTGFSVKLPAGWTISDAQRANEQATAVGFAMPGGGGARPRLYYTVYKTPPPIPEAGPEALLRENAKKKAADRVQNNPDYVNRADSFAFRSINGYPALSWTANYSDGGKKYSEYLVRVLGPKSVALFFMTAPAEEIAAARPAFDQMTETIQLP